MILKTYRAPKTLWLPLINGGRRGYWLGGAFQVIPHPEVEDVTFLQKKVPCFPLSIQPSVSAGVVRGCAAGLLSGNRICSVALEPDFLKYHDVDTTEVGVEERAFQFIRHQLWHDAVPMDPIAPSCRTPDVLDIARGYCLGEDDGQLPILADALEEAGCDNSLVLAHLRTCTDHGKQCWVVDWIEIGGER